MNTVLGILILGRIGSIYMADVRGRVYNWTAIAYRESFDYDAFKNLKIPHLMIWHDKDGIKEHCHIILLLSNKLTFDNLWSILSRTGIALIEPVIDMRGCVRYLTHMDDEDKYQYSESEVISYGVDYHHLLDSAYDKMQMRLEITKFCKEYNFVEYADLIDYCIEHNSVYFNYITSDVRHYQNYLNSARHKGMKRKVQE
jgi:hypothetical protein